MSARLGRQIGRFRKRLEHIVWLAEYPGHCRLCDAALHRPDNRGEHFGHRLECPIPGAAKLLGELHPGSVAKLPLSARAGGVLMNAGIATVEELEAWSSRDLMRLKNCGRLTVKELRAAVALYRSHTPKAGRNVDSDPMATTCILCGDPGKPRTCCDDNPVFCDAHDAVHQRRVHSDSPHRSIDDALEVAMQADELDDDNDDNDDDKDEEPTL